MRRIARQGRIRAALTCPRGPPPGANPGGSSSMAEPRAWLRTDGNGPDWWTLDPASLAAPQQASERRADGGSRVSAERLGLLPGRSAMSQPCLPPFERNLLRDIFR